MEVCHLAAATSAKPGAIPFSWGHEYLKNFIGHAEEFVQFSLAIKGFVGPH
jgi:hypothetical protein